MTERIGIVVGMEQSFPAAFVEKVGQTPGFKGEILRLGGIRERMDLTHRVIVDRLSHEVPFYRFALKAAALAGTYVINDPFWWSADDKFFGYSLAARLGVAVPRTVMLPQKAYGPDIDPQRSLRNLEYPLDWEGITRYVGFPAILKPADGGGWKHVSRVDDMPALMRAYDESGAIVMTLQEFIDFDDYVRCICIGKDVTLPIRYDPKHRRYLDTQDFLPKGLMKRIVDDAHTLNVALGYDMNSVEFAIKDGVPYAIDFTNPAPDFDMASILPRNFSVVVDEMAKLVVRIAREGRHLPTKLPFRRVLSEGA